MSVSPWLKIDDWPETISVGGVWSLLVGRMNVSWFAVVGIFFLLVCLSPTRSGRAQEENSASTDSSLPATPLDPAPAPALVSPQEKRVYELTFDDLAFEMEKGSTFKREMLTPKINEYDGSTIKLRGFIRPSFTQSGLTKFVFVRDNQECCFGPGAALYDCVLVKLADGNKTDFTVRPVTIEGEFYLKEYQGPDGKIWSIYRLKEGVVK